MRIIYFLCALVVALSSCQKKPATSIVLQNPVDIERVDENFKVSRADLNVTGGDLLPVVKRADGTYVPCQVDDMNQDGVWDELAFVYTLGGGEKAELLLDWVASFALIAFLIASASASPFRSAKSLSARYFSFSSLGRPFRPSV